MAVYGIKIKSSFAKVTQKQKAKELGCSLFTVKRLKDKKEQKPTSITERIAKVKTWALKNFLWTHSVWKEILHRN